MEIKNGKIVLYVSLVLIGAISFFGVLFLPLNDGLKTITAMPFVGALFAALFQIIRDHSSFLKDKIKQEREHAFIVAATSHMATKVFDKHVEFSEEYIQLVQKLLGLIIEEGPSANLEKILDGLYQVRRKHRLWVTPQVADKLDLFEYKLRLMGAKYGLWSATQQREGSQKHLQEAHDLFNEILEVHQSSVNESEKEEKKNKGYNVVFNHLQDILGIQELTSLRDSVINSAGKAKERI